MEMFVLLGDDGFGVSHVLGVYESVAVCQAGAESYRRDATEDDPTFEQFYGERRVVGAYPKWGFMESFCWALEV